MPFSRSCPPLGLLLVGLSLHGPAPLLAQVPAADSAFLVRTSQALLDAVTAGDSSVWAPRLAPEWFVSDEEGQHIIRSDFLAGLHPLPAGQSGRLTVENVYLVGSRDLAVLSYDAEEEHHYYGQLLLTTFHMTDTWVKRRGRWLQLAAQATALPRTIRGMVVAKELLQADAGTYHLTADIALTMVATDSGLVLRRAGRPDQFLHALDDRIFVRDGVRGFWVFEPDSTGRTGKVVNWRDNNPVSWTHDQGQ